MGIELWLWLQWMILWIATCALSTGRWWAKGDAQAKKFNNIPLKSSRLCSHSFSAFSLRLHVFEMRTCNTEDCQRPLNLESKPFHTQIQQINLNYWANDEGPTTTQPTPHGIIRVFHFEVKSNLRIIFIGHAAQWTQWIYSTYRKMSENTSTFAIDHFCLRG